MYADRNGLLIMNLKTKLRIIATPRQEQAAITTLAHDLLISDKGDPHGA